MRSIYRGFTLRICNDNKSCDILHDCVNGTENLIGIVGSIEDARSWVDEWHQKYSN